MISQNGVLAEEERILFGKEIECRRCDFASLGHKVHTEIRRYICSMTITVPRMLREQALKSLDRLPKLSPTVSRLLSKLAFGNVAFEDLTEVVSTDPLLCGHILSTVNSAAFARSRTITSVGQAMTLLGLSRLRHIALSYSMSRLFSKACMPQIWSRTRFNLHTVATALLAESIADKTHGPNREGAFLAGLLHDTGKVLIAVTAPQQYEMALALASASGRPLFECEREIFGTDHAELSGLALTKWSFTEPVCRAVFHHHAPDLYDELILHPASDYLYLALVVQRADHFVNYLGISVTDQGSNIPGLPSLEIPGYSYDQPEVLERFQREWKQLSAFFK